MAGGLSGAVWVSCELLPHLKQLKVAVAMKQAAGSASPAGEQTGAPPRTLLRVTADTVELVEEHASRSPDGGRQRGEAAAAAPVTGLQAQAAAGGSVVQLPATVDPASVQVSHSHGHVQLSLALSQPAAPKVQSQRATDMDAPTGSDWGHAVKIECCNCRCVLAHGSDGGSGAPSGPARLFRKHIDLPSQHWHEMLECWACHHEDYSSTLQGQEGGLIFAQKSAILVGDSDLVVHPDDARLDRVAVVYTGNESVFRSTRWIRLTCRRCMYPVGECFMHRDAPADSTDVAHIKIIKFFKYRVNALLNDGRRVHMPFEQCFARDLLESAKAHATYRFFVHDEDADNHALPAVFVGAIAVSLKILFRICDFGAQREAEPLSLDEATKSDRVHLPGDLVAALVCALRRNASAYVPAPERRLFWHDASVLLLSR
ncbi:E3 ubiquitin-protein ligase E3D [Polyrhizophydium stewartii]|uniref:E3 ubiquitin-protein ligase E3D n=1 Tax=Polyrhizophydium stewartii TaxID=2732419 RepID=A0ABR4MXZ0_9FUNG